MVQDGGCWDFNTNFLPREIANVSQYQIKTEILVAASATTAKVYQSQKCDTPTPFISPEWATSKGGRS